MRAALVAALWCGASLQAVAGLLPEPLFDPPRVFAATPHPGAVALGDLDGDGVLDLVTANWGTETVSVFLGDGAGGFGAASDYASDRIPVAVAIADLTGDGVPDVAVVNDDESVLEGHSNVWVFPGNGDGTLGQHARYAIGSGPMELVTTDLDADGHTDLVIVSPYWNLVSVLRGDAAGGFAPVVLWGRGLHPSNIALGDLDADGRPDLALSDPVDHSVWLLYADGHGGFGTPVGFAFGTTPGPLAIGDVDQDGHADLVVSDSTARIVSVIRGDGAGGFGSPSGYPAGRAVSQLAIADVTSDGVPDLVAANGGRGTLTVLPGTGSGGFGAPVQIATGASAAGFALGDVSGDGRPDIVVADERANQVALVLQAHVAHPVADAGALRVRAWPNPAATEALVSFVLPERADASVRVFDTLGRRVATAFQGPLPAGVHAVRWNLARDDGRRVNAGVYLVELRAGGRKQVSRVAVLR